MKLLVFLCLIIGALALSRNRDVRRSLKFAYALKPTVHKDQHDDLERFIQYINHMNASTEEVAQRFSNIQESLKDIAELSESNPKATFALNQFSDYSEEERKMLNGLIYEPSKDNTSEYITVDADDVPETYDWREHNGVTPVRDQGGCGSCYVFGTLGAIESQLLIHKNVSSYLSAEEVLACTYNDKKYNDHGCNGGAGEGVYQFVRDKGVTDNDHWKYDSSIHHFTGMCNMTGKPIITKVKHYCKVPMNDVEKLKAVVYKEGPVSSISTLFVFCILL